ncbi:lipid-binding SYLF domain-containing protein [Tahibacter aquaticus]|uniref:Lipid-binding SYLF domain-containing protein n=1 Tax=Tahibacter aquaticus TaxID=520092 RepID=A0A4R6YM24_9GAMM|nr:lipid-binding SYLF domain-containing protein [Tahibacter aquaticus]TDR38260.1 lipid-binding SYLF domain-containing protein [Tahibacter aquaticus]
MSRPCLRVLLLLCSLLLSATVLAGETESKRAREATRVLDEIMQAPDRRVPTGLLREAHAIAVIPDVIKAGLVIGGRRGHGLIVVKGSDGTWSNPAFITMTGGSLGFQAGVQSTDVILVFRSQRGVDSIVHGKFTLGADASAAAGPVGRSAQASTDAQLKAEIYSYSRARGLFAGVALDGSVLSIDHDSNQAVYGEGVTPRRIFEGGVGNVPEVVVDFRDRLEEYTAQSAE